MAPHFRRAPLLMDRHPVDARPVPCLCGYGSTCRDLASAPAFGPRLLRPEHGGPTPADPMATAPIHRGAGGSKPGPSNDRVLRVVVQVVRAARGDPSGRRRPAPRPPAPATTRSTRSGSSGQPTTVDTRSRWTGPRPEGVHQPPPALPVRSRRTGSAGWTPRPSPRRDRVGRPSRAVHRQRRRTGHSGHRGSPATQTSAPEVEEGLPEVPAPARGDHGVHQALGLTGTDRSAGHGPGHHPSGVGVDHPDVGVEGEGHHGPGRVGADPGKRRGARREGEGPDPGGRTR